MNRSFGKARKSVPGVRIVWYPAGFAQGPIDYPRLPRKGQNADNFRRKTPFFRYSIVKNQAKNGRASRRNFGPFGDSLEARFVNFPVIQITATVAVTLYLGRCRMEIDRRNRASWDALFARLRPMRQARDSGKALYATPARLWTVYQNARAMQQIADYVQRNFASADRELIGALHRDATRARLAAMAALARYALAKPAVSA